MSTKSSQFNYDHPDFSFLNFRIFTKFVYKLKAFKFSYICITVLCFYLCVASTSIFVLSVHLSIALKLIRLYDLCFAKPHDYKGQHLHKEPNNIRFLFKSTGSCTQNKFTNLTGNTNLFLYECAKKTRRPKS